MIEKSVVLKGRFKHKNKYLGIAIGILLISGILFSTFLLDIHVADASSNAKNSTAVSQSNASSSMPTRANITKDMREKAAAELIKARQAAAEAGKQFKIAAVPGGTPDYFGITPNYANSPAPIVDPLTGNITGGIHKFVDSLHGLGANNSSQYGRNPCTLSWTHHRSSEE